MKKEKHSLSAEELRRIQEQASRVLEAERSAMLNADELQRIRAQADALAEAKRLQTLARIQKTSEASDNKRLAPQTEAPQPTSGAESAAPSADRSRKRYLIAALLVVGAGLFLGYRIAFVDTKTPKATPQASSSEQQPATAIAPAQPVESAAKIQERGAQQQPAAAEPATTKAEATASPTGAKQDAGPEIRQAVTEWAKAWSRRDPAAYLGFYAAEFQPPEGLSRHEWEAQRKSKLAKYKSINVTVKDMKISHTGGDTAQVSFVQDFKGDSFKALGTRKELGLKNIQGRWMIVSESSK